MYYYLNIFEFGQQRIDTDIFTVNETFRCILAEVMWLFGNRHILYSKNSKQQREHPVAERPN